MAIDINNFNFNDYIKMIKKDIQDRVLALSDYNISIELISGKIIVSITYKSGWKILNSINENIKMAKDENDERRMFYYADLGVDINQIIDEIERTIKFNSEIELKKELLIEKIRNLKEIFENEDIEVLRTIEFKFKKKCKKVKNNIEEIDEKEIANENNNQLENLNKDE